MKKVLQIVSFDVPYPPNYGGIIDVFYKIEALSKLGISIHLHCYLTKNTKQQIALENLCERVYYYERSSGLQTFISHLPFRVKSRNNKALIKNLTEINAPILFEGLHATYPLYKNSFKESYVRTHNIEHYYFLGLAISEKNIFKKAFFFWEAKKLKRFESVLKKAKGIFSISPFEQEYFFEKYGKKATYIPVFHQTVTQNILNSKNEKFVLYHGDLRVADNIKAALFLIKTYKKSNFKLIIAGSCKNKKVISKIKKHPNIILKEVPSEKDLDILLKNAHVNTLVTFQKTGIKLKLLNTLYSGKHVIVNSKMIEETGLETLCEIADTKSEILEKTKMLFNRDFTNENQKNRLKILAKFNPDNSAKKIVEIIFKN
ncbi:hypothetical protein [Polaribacter aestuariivivens]|uniref:hypothetical protein n=1 Tax=Polaribacter aestuariivivens TaxID=2304626 RepID=UPI003F49275D